MPKAITPQVMERLIKRYKDRKFAELNAEISKLSKQFPTHFFLHNLGGVVAAQTGLKDRALRYFNRAIEIRPYAPEAFVNLGNLYHQNGEHDKAIEVFNEAIRLERVNAGAHDGLGLVLMDLGRYKEALIVYETALKFIPKSSQILFNQGNAYQKTDQLEKAVESFNKALILQPNFFAVHNNLGHVYLDQGDFDKAIEAFQRAISLEPNSYETYCNLANALTKSQDFEKAIETYEFSLSLNPMDMGVHVNLIALLIEQNKLPRALKACKSALGFDPKSGIIYNSIGDVLSKSEKYEFAKKAYKQALVLSPKSALFLNNLGRTLLTQGLFDEAAACFQKSIHFDANFLQAYANLGFVLQSQGRFEEAKISFKEAISRKGDYALAHRMAVRLQKAGIDRAWIKQMEKVRETQNLSLDDNSQLCFAIALAYEKNSDFKKATEYYSLANKFRKLDVKYYLRRDQDWFGKIKARALDFGESKIGVEKTDSLRPIFIIGMPRSGTTLVENIISSHSQVFAGGELEYFPKLVVDIIDEKFPPDIAALTNIRNRYMSRLKRVSSGFPFVTDKLPQNFLYVGAIKLAMPEAKIIHVKREAGAVCWSNYTNYFPNPLHSYSCSLDDIVKYYYLYCDLMEFWHQRYPEEIFSIEYEKLVKEPELRSRDMLSFIGLKWEDACSRPELNKRAVLTASSHQVRQPIFTGSSEKWKQFLPYLDGAFDCFI